jgi:two-component system cell cycle response regulator DivK
MTHLLLVEDNEMNRDMLRRRLERYGFKITLACSGQEAIDLARSLQPDLVLMDLGLPVVDGWTAIRTLKGAPQTCAIPIIAISGHVMAADELRAFEAGCNSFHPKSIDRGRGKPAPPVTESGGAAAESPHDPLEIRSCGRYPHG